MQYAKYQMYACGMSIIAAPTWPCGLKMHPKFFQEFYSMLKFHDPQHVLCASLIDFNHYNNALLKLF